MTTTDALKVSAGGRIMHERAAGKFEGDEVLIKYMNRVAITLSALLSVLLVFGAAAGQTVDKDKLENAARRSRNAAKVLTVSEYRDALASLSKP